MKHKSTLFFCKHNIELINRTIERIYLLSLSEFLTSFVNQTLQESTFVVVFALLSFDFSVLSIPRLAMFLIIWSTTQDWTELL